MSLAFWLGHCWQSVIAYDFHVHLPSQTCACRHLLSNQREGKQGFGQQGRNIFFPRVNACQRISSMLGSNHSRSIGADWWPAMTHLSHLLGAGACILHSTQNKRAVLIVSKQTIFKNQTSSLRRWVLARNQNRDLGKFKNKNNAVN